MYKSLILSAVVCLFVFPSVFPQKVTKYDPYPECTKQRKSKATLAKLAKCPQPNFKSNFTDPAVCCKFWEAMSCEQDIFLAIPECKSARFFIDIEADSLKPFTCTPAASCANVTLNAAVSTVNQNVALPFEQLLESLDKNKTHTNCSSNIEVDLFHCMVPFQGLMDGTPSEKDICCDQWNFKTCAQTVTDKEKTCAVYKTKFEATYKTIGDNIAKKCPENKFTCSKSGATTVSVTVSLFALSIIVALFGRND